MDHAEVRHAVAGDNQATGSYGNLQDATLSGSETATAAEQWFYPPAPRLLPCDWVLDYHSRMTGTERDAAVPSVNTDRACDAEKFLVEIQDWAVTSELRVFCRTACL